MLLCIELQQFSVRQIHALNISIHMFLAQAGCIISLVEFQNHGKPSQFCCVGFLLFYFEIALRFIKASFLKLLLPHWTISTDKLVGSKTMMREAKR